MITGTTLHLNKSSSANDIMNYLKDGLAVGDYYREKGQSFGSWESSLASTLGLDKSINLSDEKQAFINLLQGRHPATGNLIKAHKARANGVAGYDFVSAPDKSISVMSMFDEKIIEAHQRANAKALTEIEKNASRRMRSGPSDNRIELPNKFTGNMLCCSFQHDLSRSNEPQLHSHNFIFNLTMDEDGNFYSLDQKEMKRSIRYFSTVYNSILAKEMEALGYRTEPVKHHGRIVSFRLADVPQEICDIYSSRRQEILVEGEVYKEENKLDRALTEAERDIIARETRGAKNLISEREKLGYARSLVNKAQWQALEEVNQKALRAKHQVREIDYTKAVNLAIEHLFERKSTVALREILSEVMLQHFGKLDFHDLQNYLSREENLEKHYLLDLELLRECPMAEKYVTTDQSLEREAYSVDVVNKGIEKSLPFNENFAPFTTQEHLQYEKENHVNFSNQRLLVNEVLVSRDRYLNIRGKAGTGKTTMSKELVRGIEADNGNVIVLAPTNTAVEVLKENGFDPMTVSKFLLTANRYDLNNTTILIDEAGLISSKQGSQLLYLAEKNNCRIIFQGDTHQHSSVEAGDFVRGLEEYSKILTFSLSSINRQKDKTYKNIVEMLSENRTKEALELLDKNKGITERSDYIRSAVEDFKLDDFTVPGQCLYVATTNAEVDRLNNQIRAKIKSFGPDYLQNEIDKTIFIKSNMTVARSKLANNYNPGDYIQIDRKFQGFMRGEYQRIENIDTAKNRIFLENGKFINLDNHFSDITHGVQRKIRIAEGEKILCRARIRENDLFNGEILTVKELHCRVDGKDYMKCANSNGKVKFMPQGFRHFNYGYAMTSHRSQGATVDKVVVVANNLNSESAYVALSRGRYECCIHTPNKYELINNAMEYQRPLALDIINHERKKERLEKVNPKKELNRLESQYIKNQPNDKLVANNKRQIDDSILSKEKAELQNLVVVIDKLQNRAKTMTRKLDRYQNEEKQLAADLSKLKSELAASKNQKISISGLLVHPVKSARHMNSENNLSKKIESQEQKLAEFRDSIADERELLSIEIENLDKKIKLHQMEYHKLKSSIDIATKNTSKGKSQIPTKNKAVKQEKTLGISR